MEAPEMVLSGDANIFSYCALGSAHHRPSEEVNKLTEKFSQIQRFTKLKSYRSFSHLIRTSH
jgi:hypothetical protein